MSSINQSLPHEHRNRAAEKLVMSNHRSWKHWLLTVCLIFAAGQLQAQVPGFMPGQGGPALQGSSGYGPGMPSRAAMAGYPQAGYGAPMSGPSMMPPGAAMGGMQMGGMPPQMGGMQMGGMPPRMGGMQMGGMPPQMGGMQMGGMQMGGMPPQMSGPMPGGIQPAYYGAPVGGCPACGGAGCQHCLGGGANNDFRFDFLRYLMPDPSGGCCAPRWFDIHMELMNMSREEISDTVDFTSQGITGPTVLSTDDLEFDARNGMRFSAAMQMRAGRHLEFSYFGLFGWADSAEATDTGGDLFSVMSNFGTSPPNGFDDTDRSTLQSIEYSSSLDSVELGIRSRWTGPNCVLQGSWLAGVRYIYLIEDFMYHTEGANGNMDYAVATSNSMTGGQVGGDLWVCIVPGFKFGVEVKGGVYGSRAEQNTSISSNSITTPLLEELAVDKASFVLEVGVMFIYKLNQNFTLRGGYQSLAIDGLALAPENFNPAPPFVGGTRAPVINDTGSALYHGFTVGMEWMW
jgi:hypothetical protein